MAYRTVTSCVALESGSKRSENKPKYEQKHVLLVRHGAGWNPNKILMSVV